MLPSCPSLLFVGWHPEHLVQAGCRRPGSLKACRVSSGAGSLKPAGSLELGTWLHLVASESIAAVQPQAWTVLNPTAIYNCDSRRPICPRYPPPPIRNSPTACLHAPILCGPPSGIQEDKALPVEKGILVTRGLRTCREMQ